MWTKKIRSASILLGLVMALSLVPCLAFAAGTDSGATNDAVGSELKTAASKPSQAIQTCNMNVFTHDTGKNLNAKVVEGDGALSYAATKGGDCVDVDSNGTLTFKKAGEATVTVTAAETDDYAATSVDVPIKIYGQYEYEVSLWTVQYMAYNRRGNITSLDLKLFDKSGKEVGSATLQNPKNGNKVKIPASNFADRIEMTPHIQFGRNAPFTLTGSGGIGGSINVWNPNSRSGKVFTCHYGMNAPEPEYTAPVAKPNLAADGTNQLLIHPGSVSVGGVMQYCLGTESGPNNNWSGLGYIRAKDPGTYYVWWRTHNTDYYTARYIGQGRSEIVSPKPIVVTISKGNINPTVSIDGWAFGESPKAPTIAGNTGNGTVTYEYKAQGADDSTYDATVPTNIGDYTVRATIAESTTHHGGSATADFTIAKGTLPDQDVRLAGLLSSTDTEWLVEIAQPLEDIMPADAGELSSEEIGTPTYKDGSHEPPAGVTFESYVGTDKDENKLSVVVKLTIPSSATEIPEPVQEIRLPVTVKSENYNDALINFVVVPTLRDYKEVTIANAPESVTYGDAAFTLTATVKDEATGEAVETQEGDWYWYSSDPDVLEVPAVTSAYKASDTMSVTVKGAGSAMILAWYEPSDPDRQHIGAALTESITVNKKEIAPNVELEGWGYGNKSNEPSVSGIGEGTDNTTVSTQASTYALRAVAPQEESSPVDTGDPFEGIEVTYEFKVKGADDSTYTTTFPTRVGDYTVRATIAETNNYAGGTCTADFTISPKPITATVTAMDKTYDGTTDVAVSATVNASDLLEDDLDDGAQVEDGKVTIAGLRGSFVDANAGENKEINLDYDEIVSPVKDATNYDVTIAAMPTATIEPRTVYVNADDKSSPYGAKIAELTYSLYGPATLAKGDALKSLGITASTTATSNSKVGDYPITLSGGKGNSNYDVQFGEDGGIYTITAGKVSNKLTVKTATKTVKASKKAQTVKPITKVKPKFKAKVTYVKVKTAKAKKLKGYKVLTVNAKTGKVKVKKGTKAGTYKLMVKVTAAETANTKAASKTVTVTVKVKGKAAK